MQINKLVFGVLVLGCLGAAGIGGYMANRPATTPAPATVATPEQYFVNLGDYLLDRLAGGNAVFAGEELRDRPRSVGVVHFEQEPPVFGDLERDVEARAAARGYRAAATETIA